MTFAADSPLSEARFLHHLDQHTRRHLRRRQDAEKLGGKGEYAVLEIPPGQSRQAHRSPSSPAWRKWPHEARRRAASNQDLTSLSGLTSLNPGQPHPGAVFMARSKFGASARRRRTRNGRQSPRHVRRRQRQYSRHDQGGEVFGSDQTPIRACRAIWGFLLLWLAKHPGAHRPMTMQAIRLQSR